MTTAARLSLAAVALLIGAGALAYHQAPAIAAGALLHPARRPLATARPDGCSDATFDGHGVVLRGWACPARGKRRGTVIFLHGVADNRGGAAGAFGRFTSRGFDVVAYDSRAHGESGGEICTYGYYERDDLRRVVDVLPPGPVVLVGSSLGGAVALQTAAADGRISTVVAAEVFSDLVTVVRERAPFLLPERLMRSAFSVAERQGRFEIDRVSPAQAAHAIAVPVLLIHGRMDADTPPAHSERVFANLRGPRRLILVEGAGHNQSLGADAIWEDIVRWVEAHVAMP